VRRVTPGQGNLTDQWHRKYTAYRLAGAPQGAKAGRGNGEKVR
jgi:hypothetical protein